MTDLFWPGDERAGTTFSERHFLDAMVAVEEAWSAGLAESGLAPKEAAVELGPLVTDDDLEAIAARAEDGGNPVLPLLGVLRARLSDDAAAWLHRGMTSQDVVDTALMVCLRDVLAELQVDLDRQTDILADLIKQHRETPMVARTLTQHAVPSRFALKASSWLGGVLSAAELVRAAHERLPVQLGGAAGTMAATVSLAESAGAANPVATVAQQCEFVARRLGLAMTMPWHTVRTPITRAGDALVSCTDAWGHLAGDILTGSRPEIGELSEPAVSGRGGSSAMPRKRNPVLAVLVNRAGLAGPASLAQLHLAAATTSDERPPGSWHVEWSVLRTLGRHTLAAGRQTTELLTGLLVHTDRMAANLDAARLAPENLAAVDVIVTAVLARAERIRS